MGKRKKVKMVNQRRDKVKLKETNQKLKRVKQKEKISQGSQIPMMINQNLQKHQSQSLKFRKQHRRKIKIIKVKSLKQRKTQASRPAKRTLRNQEMTQMIQRQVDNKHKNQLDLMMSQERKILENQKKIISQAIHCLYKLST